MDSIAFFLHGIVEDSAEVNELTCSTTYVMNAPTASERAKSSASIVFLGGGRITRALVSGLRAAGHGSRLVVFDRHPEKLRSLRMDFDVEMARDLTAALQFAGILIIAVRPASCVKLLKEISLTLNPGGRPVQAVSLVVGIPLVKLRSTMGSSVRWARAMPSPICSIKRGLTAVCFDRNVSAAQRHRVRKLFSEVGDVVEIPERQFDAFTAAYSPSYGYHALASLAQAAQEAGLERATAFKVAAHAVGDAVTYWRELGLPNPRYLLAEAATPGGTAEATVAAMKRAGFDNIVAQGLRAGIRRARRYSEL